ncbi:hypothetical protein NP493_295g04041 [Ridgeia piscesae]|uniref:G-protein coupled receptors family 1 profile domain-containing protein n=1 Tax=Ridgeia piscesae TaxID=27915 RepID=A0AAD9NWL1_RIDPI|nr:hypothetical protein NP493_295g04041 [Ridgeia piscesae]
MDFPFVANISEVLPALMTSHPAIALPYVTLLGIFAFVGTLGNILVIGTNLTKKKKDQMCIFDRGYQYFYTLFFVLAGVGIPLVILSVAYVRIFMHLHAAKESLMKTSSKPAPGGKSPTSAFRQSMKQAKMMLAIFLAFVTLWSPYLIVLVVDRYDRFPLAVHLYASLFAHMHASVNFIIYGVANKSTRVRYKQFISEKLMCRHFVTRVEPENSTGGSVTQNG